MTEDEKVGWHHRFNGHEFEQAPGVGDGQGGLACYGPWNRKGLDTTELNLSVKQTHAIRIPHSTLSTMPDSQCAFNKDKLL